MTPLKPKRRRPPPWLKATGEKTALNVREVPAELLWECKALAAEGRQTLREFVMSALRRHIEKSRSRQDEAVDPE